MFWRYNRIDGDDNSDVYCDKHVSDDCADSKIVIVKNNREKGEVGVVILAMVQQ